MKSKFKSITFWVFIAAAWVLIVDSALIQMREARAQTTVPGVQIVPLGYCQLSAGQLAAAIALSALDEVSP